LISGQGRRRGWREKNDNGYGDTKFSRAQSGARS
jgi:hypothetical protein